VPRSEEILMESVYRSHKGSYKIESSKARGSTFLAFILYILFGEPPIDKTCVLDARTERRIKTVLKKHFERDSYFFRCSLRFLDSKTGEKNEKTGWVNIEPYIYTTLGGELFFYCTLRALIDVSKKALKDKKYDYSRPMSWKEGIVDYLIHEAIYKRPSNTYVLKEGETAL
jgi:hypothetical protein